MMRTACIRILILAGTTAIAADSAIAQSIGYVAVERGQVAIDRGDQRRVVDGSAELQIDDVVVTQTGSRAVVLVGGHKPVELENGQTLTLEGRFFADRSQRSNEYATRGIRAIVKMFLPGFSFGRHSSDTIKGDDDNDAAIVRFHHPVPPKVLTGRPDIAWRGASSEYRLRLFKTDDPYLWLHEATLASNGMIGFPPNWPDLQHGREYFLELSSTADASDSATVEFSVASVAEIQEVEGHLARQQRECQLNMVGSENCQLMRAGHLSQEGYNDEAISVLRGLLSDESVAGVAELAIRRITGEDE